MAEDVKQGVKQGAKERQPLTPDDLIPGQWVLVAARVVDQTSPIVEEARLMLRSHNEDYVVLVHQDYLVEIAPAPKHWPRCTAGKREQVQVGEMMLDLIVQCMSSAGHPGSHEGPREQIWADRDPGTVYIEEG